MVLEALVAAGLVGNIIQFVDFSCKLFDLTKSIYNSSTGAPQDRQDTEFLTRSLQQICTNLSQSKVAAQAQQPRLQGHRPNLVKLAQDCEATARELLAVLQRLRAHNPNSAWSSFYAAIKTVCKESEIKSIKKRLDTYRSQLGLEINMFQQ